MRAFGRRKNRDDLPYSEALNENVFTLNIGNVYLDTGAEPKNESRVQLQPRRRSLLIAFPFMGGVKHSRVVNPHISLILIARLAAFRTSQVEVPLFWV